MCARSAHVPIKEHPRIFAVPLLLNICQITLARVTLIATIASATDAMEPD